MARTWGADVNFIRSASCQRTNQIMRYTDFVEEGAGRESIPMGVRSSGADLPFIFAETMLTDRSLALYQLQCAY